jgi:Fic family protein
MSLQPILDNIDSKIKELDDLRPIDPERMKVIYNKFKLDSNFYTNHFEGNTLTIGETKQLILFGLNASIAKKVRHVEEMRGHIEAFDELGFLTDRVLTDDKLPLELNQSLIKNLHKLIFVQDEIIHKSENGIDTVTTLPAGNYKIHPNSVMTSSGTLFEYSDPTQAPSLMSDLLDWYNSNRSSLNPVVLASIFHYKFIRIHPFGDGNGRMARLLMNLILQSSGYGLIIVKSDQQSRDEYINALSLTDNNFLDITQVNNSTNVKNFEQFINVIAKLELESLDLMIRGAKGEDITEVGDLIKEMEFESKIKINQNYSIDDILEDKNLNNELEKELVALDKIINSFFAYKIKGIFYRCFMNNPHEMTSKASNFGENSSFYYRINVTGIRGGDETFGLELYITINFTIGGYYLMCNDVGGEVTEKISFEYLNANFNQNLKKTIKMLNNFIDKKIENN